MTLPTWHTGLLFRRETPELVAEFLATGGFPRHAAQEVSRPKNG